MTYSFYPVRNALYFDTSLLPFNKNQFHNTELIEVPLINFEVMLEQENIALPLINHVFTNLNMLSEQYLNFRKNAAGCAIISRMCCPP